MARVHGDRDYGGIADGLEPGGGSPGPGDGTSAVPDARDHHDDGTDTVEFSTTGTQLAELEDSSSTIRVDKVARIRSEIANGLYDVDGKLESILGRVLKDALS